MEISYAIERARYLEKLTGIKALHKKHIIMGKDVMTMRTILKNVKLISIAPLQAFINLYNGNHIVTIFGRS